MAILPDRRCATRESIVMPTADIHDTYSNSDCGHHEPRNAVAIIGMGCRLPGAGTDPESLWDMLMRKETANGKVPRSRWDVDKFLSSNRLRFGSMTTAGGYFLRDDPTLFEPQLFNINPQEAATLDPAVKKLLEVVYEVIESAGITLESLAGSDTGCYVGSFNHDELFSKVRDSHFADTYTGTAAIAPFLANRISYVFDLHGPSLTVDTACSASFYALHLACQAIRSKEITSAIVASSNLIWSPDMQMFLDKLGALSPTSQSHVFSSDADGYGRSDGFVGFFLKDLETAIRDRDPIQAVIAGTAVNSNGRVGGITHPSPSAQESAMRQAYRSAGSLSPGDTTYYECHGTGTAVGDPLELQGVQSFFAPDRAPSSPLLLGSIKSNIGHSEPVSGLAGLLKAVMAIKKGVIPPMITPRELNPALNLDQDRFRLVTEPCEWPEGKIRRASVASSGFGGANAHVIVENFDCCTALNGHENGLTNASLDATKYLLPFSSHKADALAANVEAIRAVSSSLSAIDLANTLDKHRSRLLSRGYVITSGVADGAMYESEDLKRARRVRKTPPRTGYVFTGQGAQWPQMGKELFARFPPFAEAIHRMSRTLKDLPDGPDWDLKDVLLAPAETSRVYSAEISQPACTAVQIGLVAILQSWNLEPDACAGHSSGEMAAAFAANWVSEEHAICAAYYRGLSVSRLSVNGAMIAVGASAQAVQEIVNLWSPRICIAAINSPESTTISGDKCAVEELKALLDQKGVFNRLLSTGGRAYHSHHMKAVGELFETSLDRRMSSKSRTSHAKCTQFFSSVSGKCISIHDEINPKYWRNNMESPVLFSAAMEQMLTSGIEHIIEIGPHPALAGPIRQIESSLRERLPTPCLYSSTLERKRSGEDCLLELAGSLYNDSANIDISKVNAVCRSEQPARKGQAPLTNLPPYQYAYGASNMRMSRIEREFRFPKHNFHDLLGQRILGVSPRAPSWRNILSTKQSPWLSEMSLREKQTLPTSCILVMILAAAQQLLHDEKNAGVDEKSQMVFTEILFSNPLSLSTSQDVVTSFHRDASSPYSYTFAIDSLHEDHALAVCSGRVRFQSRGANSAALRGPKLYPTETNPKKWYAAFEKAGLRYGAPWKMLGKIETNARAGYSRCQLEAPGKALPTLPSQYIEACVQTALIATAPHGQPREFQLAYPTTIGTMTCEGDLSFGNPAELHILSHLKLCAQSDDLLVDLSLQNAAGGQLLGLADVRIPAADLKKLAETDQKAALQLKRKPDFAALSPLDAKIVFPTPMFPDADVFGKVHRLASAMAIEFVSSHPAYAPPRFSDAGEHFLNWLRAAVAHGVIPHGSELGLLTPRARREEIETLYQAVQDQSVEAQLMMRMYRDLAGVIEGDVSAHDLLLSDGLLGDLYTSKFTAMGSMTQLRGLIDLVGHKMPEARYLEIGGGTRGATREILDVLGAHSGPRRYGSYCFTDVSSAFLGGAKEEFKDFENMRYSPLNIERLPSEQGFEVAAYDVVVAANVLHATSSIQRTLAHTRSLLKPGGKLILVETTIETVWLTIVLGGFADYWKGKEDSRPTSPFLSVEQWTEVLRSSGFTSPQIDLSDYEEPFRSMNVMLCSAAGDSSTSTNGHAHRPSFPQVERFYPIGTSKHEEVAALTEKVGSGSPTSGLSRSHALANPIAREHALRGAVPLTVALIDWNPNRFFDDLVGWIAQGYDKVILARSEATTTTGFHYYLPAIKRLCMLGLDVHYLQMPLLKGTVGAIEQDLADFTSSIQAIWIDKSSGSESTVISHAQHFFTAALKPEQVFVLANAEDYYRSEHHLSRQLLESACAEWASTGTSAYILGCIVEDTMAPGSLISEVAFDDVIPTVNYLVDNLDRSVPEVKIFLFGFSPPQATSAQADCQGLQSDERFGIVLQAAKDAAGNKSDATSTGVLTAKHKALTRLQGLAHGDRGARAAAAADLLAEVLAEILFIERECINVYDSITKSGIDSLVASELRTQIKRHFEIDVATGRILGGALSLQGLAEELVAG